METDDNFEEGDILDPTFVASFLETIDCYVMGSRTYETALKFEAQGHDWAYGDKPTFVLTSRDLPCTRTTVEFFSGDPKILMDRLQANFASIWVVGGGAVAGEFLRLGLAHEIRYSILPVLIGDGIPFFAGVNAMVELHLKEVTAYRNGIVALRHEVKKRPET